MHAGGLGEFVARCTVQAAGLEGVILGRSLGEVECSTLPKWLQ
jgi:hypothetical protein